MFFKDGELFNANEVAGDKCNRSRKTWCKNIKDVFFCSNWCSFTVLYSDNGCKPPQHLFTLTILCTTRNMEKPVLTSSLHYSLLPVGIWCQFTCYIMGQHVSLMPPTGYSPSLCFSQSRSASVLCACM